MIGISTLAYTSKDLETTLSDIEKHAAHAEIFSEGVHDIIHTKNGSILPSFSLSYSLHAPTMDVNLASAREKIREAGIQIMRDSAVFCMNSDIEIMVVHPGYTANKEMLTTAYKSFEKSISDLQKIKEETGVRICIENMPDADIYLFRNPEDLDLESKNIEFILDIGHANTTDSLNEFLKKEVIHYHIHDNMGDTDSHLGFGDGTIGFPVLEQIIEKAKKDKAILIAENKTIDEAMKTIGALRKAGAD